LFSGFVQFLKLRSSNVPAKLTTSHMVTGNLCPHQLQGVKKSGGNLGLSIDGPSRNGQVLSTRQAKNVESDRPELWMSVGRKWTAVV